MTPSDLREKVARAICRAEHPMADLDAEYGFNCASEFVPGGEGGETKPHAWLWYVGHADAALKVVLTHCAEMAEHNARFAYGYHARRTGELIAQSIRSLIPESKS